MASALIKTFQGENYIFDPAVSQWFPMDRKGDPKPVKKEVADALDAKFGVQSSVERPLPEAAQKLQTLAGKKKAKPSVMPEAEGGLAAAERTGKKSFGDIAAQRMMEGKGLGGAIGAEIAERFQARKQRFKSLPLRMAKSLPLGNLLATSLGKAFGYAPEDIAHVTGMKASARKARQDTNSLVPPSPTDLTATPMGPNKETAVDVLEKIYKLIHDKFEEDKRLREIASQFNKDERGVPMMHKVGGETIPAATGNERGGGGLAGLLPMLANLLPGGGMLGKGIGLISRLGKGILKYGSKALKFMGRIGAKALGLFGVGAGAAAAAKAARGAPEALVQGAKTGSTVAESATAVEEGSKMAKVANTATKVSRVAGAGGKMLKGLGKLLGFMKSIPGIGLIAGGVDAIMRIQDIMARAEAGEQMDMKKEIVKALGGVLASGALPIIGGLLGSAVFPGVGTIVGSLGGVAASLLGGDKIGEWGAEKMYDFFMNDKKSTEAVPIPGVSRVPGTPTASPVQNQKTSRFGTMPKATPAAPVPAPTTNRLNAAQDSHVAMTLPVAGGMQSPPIVVNKTTMAPPAPSRGGSGGSVGVRNDDSTLQRLQYGLIRTV